MARKHDTDQLPLDFSSQLHERLAWLRALELPIARQTGWTPERIAGVIELLQRIVICSHDHTTSHARVITLGAGLHDRRKVSEKTIRNWKRDAKELGLLGCEEVSHHRGGHHTNVWQVQWHQVRALRLDTRPEVGRKRGGNGYRPGAETVTALTVDSSSYLDPNQGGSPWHEIQETLHQAGLKVAEKVARDCQQQGMTPHDVATVLDQFQANRERCGWGVGAIVFRLRHGSWPSEPRPLPVRKPQTVIADGLEIGGNR